MSCGLVAGMIVLDDQIEKIEAWAIEGSQLEGGTRYKAMSYEDGMLDMIGILTGEHTVEDIIS
jgi:hypothetical protein